MCYFCCFENNRSNIAGDELNNSGMAAVCNSMDQSKVLTLFFFFTKQDVVGLVFGILPHKCDTVASCLEMYVGALSSLMWEVCADLHL